MGSPCAAHPGVLRRRGCRGRTSQQHGLGGSCVSAWTRTSRLFAGTVLRAAWLPLPGKCLPQNSAPSLFFRHSRSDSEANVNQGGEHGKERARRLPQLPRQARKARLTNGSPSTPGMRCLHPGTLPPPSSGIPAKKQHRDAFLDKRDIWQPTVYIGGLYLLFSASSKTSCPAFLPVPQLLARYEPRHGNILF